MSLNDAKPLVLMVDDTEMNLRVLGQLLRQNDFQVAAAMNGPAAIRAATTRPPDVILLDVAMPGMDGFQVCQILKDDTKLLEIPVIFLTAFSDTDKITKGFQLGAVDYVTKPFNHAELLARVRTHVALKRARDEQAKALDELRRVNALKDRLFSILGHDLRGPLGSFMNVAEMLAKEASMFTPEDIHETAKEMAATSRGLYRLLENLLDWSRLQMGGLVVHMAPTELDVVTASVVELVSLQARQKKINLLQEIESPGPVVGDMSLLQTLVRNLVGNCLKFTPEGGQVKLRLSEVGESSVVLEISDTGIGMPAELVESIRRAEVRRSRPGTGGEKGTGLGMLLCQDIAARHQAKFEVESIENAGTTIRITFPKSHHAMPDDRG